MTFRLSKNALCSKIFSRTLASVLCFTQLTASAQSSLNSRVSNSLNRIATPHSATQAQFRFDGTLGAGMMSVEVVGAINNSGLYHVPQGTSVSDLISLAGGFSNHAELDKSLLRRRSLTKKSETFIKLNLEDYYEGNSSQGLPHLQEGDLLYIPVDEPAIDRDTSTIITALGAVASTVLSIFLIRREITRND